MNNHGSATYKKPHFKRVPGVMCCSHCTESQAFHSNVKMSFRKRCRVMTTMHVLII